MSPSLRWPVGSAVALCVLFTHSRALPAAQATRDLYVAVADANDRPVTGLTVADFIARVGDAAQPISSVKPATGPITLVFVNDTSVEDVQAVSRAFQSSVSLLAARNPGAKVDLVVLRRPTTFVDARMQAAKTDPFDGALSGGYALPTGAVHVMDALNATPGRHVVLGVTRKLWPADLATTRLGDAIPIGDFNAALRTAKASLWVVEIAPILSGKDNTDLYLDQSVWPSGGWELRINDLSALEPTMNRLVEILLSQYVVSVPDSPALTAGTIRVGVKRNGTTVSTAEYPQG